MSPPDRTTPVATPPAMAPRAALYIGRLRRLTGSWVPAALIVLVLLGVWEGYVRLWAVPKWLLPAPSVIAPALAWRATGSDSASTSMGGPKLTRTLLGSTLRIPGGIRSVPTMPQGTMGAPVSRANQAGFRLSPKHLLQHQTIAELALVGAPSVAIQADQGLIVGRISLTPIQHWFFEQELTEPEHYNQALLLRLREPLDSTIVKTAVGHILMHQNMTHGGLHNR